MPVILGRKGGGGGGGGAPTGAAGGDLGGTYPNPDVAVVDDAVLGSGTPDATTFLRGDRAWTLPPGSELGYAQVTTNVSPGGTEGSPNAVVTLGAITYAAVPTIIEFGCSSVDTTSSVIFELMDGNTELCRFIDFRSASGTNTAAQYAQIRLTPSAGSHTYRVAAFGSGTIYGGTGAGGAATYGPIWIRATLV